MTSDERRARFDDTPLQLPPHLSPVSTDYISVLMSKIFA